MNIAASTKGLTSYKWESITFLFTLAIAAALRAKKLLVFLQDLFTSATNFSQATIHIIQCQFRSIFSTDYISVHPLFLVQDMEEDYRWVFGLHPSQSTLSTALQRLLLLQLFLALLDPLHDHKLRLDLTSLCMRF